MILKKKSTGAAEVEGAARERRGRSGRRGGGTHESESQGEGYVGSPGAGKMAQEQGIK